MSAQERKALRKALRAKRRAIPLRERRIAAIKVAQHALGAGLLRPGKRIAIYAALAEELDTAPLIAAARARGCRIYLPRITPRGGRMHFVAASPRTRRNRLGIEEPAGSTPISTRSLDVVFLPLVGFDRRGVRLGMGGGYYDRAFAFRRWRTSWHRPKLIGLAYEVQRVDALEAEPHDVRLDGVITERGAWRCVTG